MAEIDAARPALIIHRGDRGVRRPPVPAELVHGLADQRAGKPERLRRHRRARQRRHRIARKARDAHHPVVLFEERRERVVINRPVISDAVERLHLEIGRVQPRPMRGVHHGRAADAVEVHHLDRRIVVIDRIVLGPAADIRAGRPVAIKLRLPVAPGARIVRRVHPAALVEAENVHLGFSQAPRHRRTRGAGADDQHVDLVVTGGHAPLRTGRRGGSALALTALTPSCFCRESRIVPHRVTLLGPVGSRCHRHSRPLSPGVPPLPPPQKTEDVG